MLEGLPILDLGASALLAITVLFVLTDRLVWHKRLDEKQRQIDAMQKQIDEQGKQITMLMRESVPTVNAVLTALHRAAEEEP